MFSEYQKYSEAFLTIFAAKLSEISELKRVKINRLYGTFKTGLI